MDSVDARRLLLACYQAGVAAADPEAAVAASLGPQQGRVVVLALGKAAPAMARGAARALGRERLEGLVVSNHRDAVPAGLRLMLGSHPVPDQRSVAAGEALLELAESLDESDTAIVLISGGGSALVEAPVAGVTIADLAATTQTLLRSGADIIATNTVRRSLSRIKGGGLADAIAPARVITRAVSDVVGDDPTAIASGPTVAAGDSREAALAVIDQLGLRRSLPGAVLAALERPSRQIAASPGHDFKIVASSSTAAHAAADEAERLGIPAQVLDTRMTGDAALTAGEVLRRARLGVSVFAGETTVDVTGDGIGGRNHEAALVAATLIDGRSDVWFLAAGTDGIDAMTGAAGTIVDGDTITRSLAAGLDAGLALERNDSGRFFSSLGEQIVTGPSGTNVGDLWLVLRD